MAIKAELPMPTSPGRDLRGTAYDDYGRPINGFGSLPDGINVLLPEQLAQAKPTDMIQFTRRSKDSDEQWLAPAWLAKLGGGFVEQVPGIGGTLGFRIYDKAGNPSPYLYTTDPLRAPAGFANTNPEDVYATPWNSTIPDPGKFQRVLDTPQVRRALEGGHFSLLNGQKYDIIDPSGNVSGQGTFQGMRDTHDIDQYVGLAAATIATMGAASAASAGAAGGASAGGAGAGAGAAGAGMDAATAAELAASNVVPASSGAFIPATAGEMSAMGGLGAAGAGITAGSGAMGAGAAGSGVTDLGGGLTMGADGSISGATGAFTPATGAEMAGMGVPASGGLLQTIGNAASSVFGNGGGSVLGSGGWGSLLAPAASLIGSAMQANAAGNAAEAMTNAANAGIAEQRRQFDTVRELLRPYVEAGNTSLGAYQNLSGANGADAQRQAMAELETSPQFASMTKAGENAILQNASATGGLRGGNIQGALYDHRAALLNGLQQQRLGNYLPIVNTGQASAAGVGNAAMASGANISNLQQQAGAAQAGGIVAGTNAITNGIGALGGFFAGQSAGNVGGATTPAPINTSSVQPTNGMVPGFGSGIVPGYGFQPRYF